MPSPLRVLLALACLLCALAAPAVASADHRHDDTWEDWRPEPDTSTEEDEGGYDDGTGTGGAPWWLPDVDEGGTGVDDVLDEVLPDPEPVVPTPAPAAPSKPATGGSSKLRGVKYRTLILRYARMRSLDPALVAAVIHAESAFNPRAVSRVGARGLMQLMPATARGLGASVKRLFDPATNISYGTLYLARVRRIVGSSTRLMAAAYNAGPGAVKRYRGVPPYAETRGYVRKVAALQAAYRRR